jgi:LysM repeat protein
LNEKSRLKRGTVLLVPRKEALQVASKSPKRKTPTQAKAVAARNTTKPKSYTVRGGDTLYRIALQHGTTVAILMSANSLGSPASIHPGDRLKIPTKGD